MDTMDEIRVDLLPSDSIYFTVGIINMKLDVHQFQNIHSCRSGLSDSCLGSLKRGIQLMIISGVSISFKNGVLESWRALTFIGVALVVFNATASASSSYFLSKLIGRHLVFSIRPDKLQFFHNQVAKRREGLLNYMLFLRLTPTLPNTFINLASPIVDVPYHIFFLATIIGLIPAGYVTVRAGLALGELRKENNFLRSPWPVTNPPSSQEHLLHPQLLQKPLRPFLARGYFDDVGV